jgi:hypothetical protein
MRKIANIAWFIAVFVIGWFLAGLLLDGEMSKIAPDVARWLWGLGVLIVGILGQLSWKVHEAKRVEGLNAEQRLKVRKVAGLIGMRIYYLALIVFLGSCLGIVSVYVSDPETARHMTQAAFGSLMASAFICIFFVPITQRDIQRFEDKAREELALQKSADALAEKLKKRE